MSLITRCPACQTLFRVVPDQLRVSEGWVRCGQCDEIFDASSQLLPNAPAIDPLSVPPDPTPTPTPITPAPAPAPQFAQIQLDPQELAALTQTEEAFEQAAPFPDDTAAPDVLLSEPLDWQPPPPDAALPECSADPQLDACAPIDSGAQVLDRRAEFGDVSFLREKHANSFWSKPLVHFSLILISLVLLIGLAGQMVLHERDRIAAAEPGLKPWLLTLCRALNCSLSPVRKIESIVIDSASFTKIRGDAYRLNFTVKNNEALELALPAIELTLTDTLDQPVIRRVFLPSELGSATGILAASSEWAVALPVAVKDAVAASKVAGYRVLAFYP